LVFSGQAPLCPFHYTLPFTLASFLRSAVSTYKSPTHSFALVPNFAMSSQSLSSSSSTSLHSPSRNPTYDTELDHLGFAGISRTRNYPTQSLPAPPPYVRFESQEHQFECAGVNWSYAEPLTDDIVCVTHGEVIKAKLRYKLHKLRHGKHAEPWDVFQNRFLKPGEVPWAPLDSPLWKLPRSSIATVNGISRRSSF